VNSPLRVVPDYGRVPEPVPETPTRICLPVVINSCHGCGEAGLYYPDLCNLLVQTKHGISSRIIRVSVIVKPCARLCKREGEFTVTTCLGAVPAVMSHIIDEHLTGQFVTVLDLLSTVVCFRLQSDYRIVRGLCRLFLWQSKHSYTI